MSVTFRGFPACACLAEWLPWYERVLLKRGVIKKNIDIAQLIGKYAASGLTHSTGGVYDIWQTGPASTESAREMGGIGSSRTRRQGFRPHQHGPLKGCPHLHPTAQGQVEDIILRDMNGLTGRVRGRDADPRPNVWRTWKEGIDWAKGYLGTITTTPGVVSQDTIFDIAWWNVASPKWFKRASWASRKAAIGATLAGLDCSVVCCGETHFSYQTADILKSLGPAYAHVSSPVGNDIFFDKDRWEQVSWSEKSLGIQGRCAGFLHLRRRATGQDVVIVTTHFPNAVFAWRTRAAKKLIEYMRTVEFPIVLVGDFNNESFRGATPHGLLRQAGYEFMREQGYVRNGGLPEYPDKKQWLSDIATDRDRRPATARITSGELRVTSSSLSDHHPLKARIHVKGDG